MKRLENGRFELTEEELVKLFAAEAELEALECAGVDNWAVTIIVGIILKKMVLKHSVGMLKIK